MPRLARRNDQILQSDIRAMTLECTRAGGINLAQGICDLPLAPPVQNGAVDAMARGLNAYTRFDGIPELRDAIAATYRSRYTMTVDPGTDIVATCGATGAFYAAGMALFDPGDEVIVFEPYYGYHVHTLAALGVVPVFVPLAPPAWTLDTDLLARAITPRTRAIVVNTPANPSGKVFTVDELRAIGALAAKHDLTIITDEIYEHFVYGTARHVPMATLDGMRERTLTISGLSKTFSITGWRIGWVLGPERIIRAIGSIADLVYVCAPAPLQAGAARGLTQLDPGYYRELSVTFARRREIMCRALHDAGLEPMVPAGAYYVLADLSRIAGANSLEKALRLLHQTGIACVPGRAFFHDGGGDALGRFCFAKDDAILEDVARRLLKLS